MKREAIGKEVIKLISSDREKSYGDPHVQFETAQILKTTINERLADHVGLDSTKSEALDLIATKISRIISGNPNHRDSWADIAGYALIAAESCKK